MTYQINIGDTIPAFKVVDPDGDVLTDDDLIGSPVVIYFYPKDDTPGCTKEACALRDNMERIAALDAIVIGISPDNKASHAKFKQKYDLNFTLLPDEKKELCAKFDIHKALLGIERTTFVIDREGIIRWIERPVSVSGHVDRIIAALETLNSDEE